MTERTKRTKLLSLIYFAIIKNRSPSFYVGERRGYVAISRYAGPLNSVG